MILAISSTSVVRSFFPSRALSTAMISSIPEISAIAPEAVPPKVLSGVPAARISTVL